MGKQWLTEFIGGRKGSDAFHSFEAAHRTAYFETVQLSGATAAYHASVVFFLALVFYVFNGGVICSRGGSKKWQ